jgi:hypothetical protein
MDRFMPTSPHAKRPSTCDAIGSDGVESKSVAEAAGLPDSRTSVLDRFSIFSEFPWRTIQFLSKCDAFTRLQII